MGTVIVPHLQRRNPIESSSIFCLRWLRYFAPEIIHLVPTPCCLMWVVPVTSKAPVNVMSSEAVVWRMEQLSSNIHYHIGCLGTGNFPFELSCDLGNFLFRDQLLFHYLFLEAWQGMKTASLPTQSQPWLSLAEFHGSLSIFFFSGSCQILLTKQALSSWVRNFLE